MTRGGYSYALEKVSKVQMICHIQNNLKKWSTLTASGANPLGILAKLDPDPDPESVEPYEPGQLRRRPAAALTLKSPRNCKTIF
jgi:hypothetical protein